MFKEMFSQPMVFPFIVLHGFCNYSSETVFLLSSWTMPYLVWIMSVQPINNFFATKKQSITWTCSIIQILNRNIQQGLPGHLQFQHGPVIFDLPKESCWSGGEKQKEALGNRKRTETMARRIRCLNEWCQQLWKQRNESQSRLKLGPICVKKVCLMRVPR